MSSWRVILLVHSGYYCPHGQNLLRVVFVAGIVDSGGSYEYRFGSSERRRNPGSLARCRVIVYGVRRYKEFERGMGVLVQKI